MGWARIHVTRGKLLLLPLYLWGLQHSCSPYFGLLQGDLNLGYLSLHNISYHENHQLSFPFWKTSIVIKHTKIQ